MSFSSLIERARWRICESYVEISPKYYLDQISSEKAIDSLQEFLEDYPNSAHIDSANKTMKTMRNKLGEKAYETGILYIKLAAYDSAILAFEYMLENYYDSKFVDEAHLEIIRSYGLMKDFNNAKEYYDSKKHMLPLEAIQKAEKILQKIKK